MKVVVTGASGNAGVALLRALPEGWEVVGVARRPPDPGCRPFSRARWLRCDLGAPGAVDALLPALRGADAVVHLAWAVQPRRAQPAHARSNVLGSRNLLRAAAAAGVGQLVCASSTAVYAAAGRWRRVDETWPALGLPGSAYSQEKVAFEGDLDRFEAERPQVRVARIRPAGILQADAGGQFADQMLSPVVPRGLVGSGRLPVPLWPALRVQAVHADDVADAVVRLLRSRTAGAFNLAAEPVLTASLLARQLGGRLVPVPLALLRSAAWVTWRTGLQPLHPGWLTVADQAALVDTGRARAELGWQPRHDAARAVAETAEAIRERWQAGSVVLSPPPARVRLGAPSHQSQATGRGACL